MSATSIVISPFETGIVLAEPEAYRAFQRATAELEQAQCHREVVR
jgi:hypothetical protein